MKLRTQSNGVVLTERAFRAALSNVSLPKVLTQPDVEPLGYDIIQPADRPTTTEYQVVTEGEPVEVDGVWTQTWVVSDRFSTPEELEAYEAEKVLDSLLSADYVGFWKAFIRSATYAGIKEAAKTSLEANVTATELISLLGDAKTDHVDPEALQVGIWEVAGQLPEEANAELRVLMDTYGMNNYSLAA